MNYNESRKKFEPKWQKTWEKSGIYNAKTPSAGSGQAGEFRPKYYAMFEFPYPSGSGMHVGHVRSQTAMDIISRKRRMEGFNVLYPIGWDAFGLPTENYAIKMGIDPAVATKQNTDNFRRQLKAMGFGLDWDREIDTTDPEYYKWTQWMFLKFFEKGLAYKAKTYINWCPKDKIGLANEEAAGGVCDRCGGPVEKREKEQWMIAITKYADRLLEGLKDVDYIPQAKTQQENWIGRSEGAEIEFPVVTKNNYVLLHGFTGTTKGNFFPWLIEKLKSQGADVYAPDLPNTNTPTEDEQVNFVLENAKFDENTILFGHSLGTVVAMKVAEKLKGKIAGLVLASGFIDMERRTYFKKVKRAYDDAFRWQFDFEKIKSSCGFIKVLADKNDDSIDLKTISRLHAAIGGKYIETVAEKPHFCATEEPAILSALQSSIKVFTTRPDTIFGATYLVVAPEHRGVAAALENPQSLLQNKEEVRKYVESIKNKSEEERLAEGKEKTGVELKGLRVINPATKQEIPVWVADYVLSTYGTGAIMAVPQHDERDRAFAEKFKLPIIDKPLISMDEAIKITSGKKTVKYKLRDWVFSRQRYWGEPIPLVFCEHCAATNNSQQTTNDGERLNPGWVAVPEKDLPVKLPKVEKYQPTDTGESPLSAIESFVNVKCPKCKKPAKRETDTMPNWAGSSWYFLRYLDPKNKKEFASKKALEYFMPVDWYNGGMEHTVLHLLYSRFWNMFLHDLGLVSTSEPYKKRTSHGMVLAADGSKMSKSLGNVINPDDIIAEFGADSLRLYEMFMGPFNQAISWDPHGILGVTRFLEKVYRVGTEKIVKKGEDAALEKLLHKTIKKVTEDIESMSFNTAISSMMVFMNEASSRESVSGDIWNSFLQILAPFAPHLTEELYLLLPKKLRPTTSIHLSGWPAYDAKLIVDEAFELIVQINGKVRDKVSAPMNISQADAEKLVTSREETKKWLRLGSDDKSRQVTATPKKVVFVKNRLINLIV